MDRRRGRGLRFESHQETLAIRAHRVSAQRANKNARLEQRLGCTPRKTIAETCTGTAISLTFQSQKAYARAQNRQRLEKDFQSELHQSAAWRSDEAGDVTGASGEDVERRNVKMGLVEEIKSLRPGLHIDTLGGFEDLSQRRIGIEEPRADNGIPSQVAEGAWCRP